jgi:hypothetical protein
MSLIQRVTFVRPGVQQPDNLGIYCTEEGVFIGNACPLVAASKSCWCGGGRYRVRPIAEISALLRTAFGVDIDFDFLEPQLKKIAAYLERGELNLAQLATLFLGLPELPDRQAIHRLDAAHALLKAGFNPDEPRDEHGRWTTAGDAAVTSTPAPPQTAQIVIPEGLTPDCVAEYLWAYHRCSELANDGAFGPRSGFGNSMSQCIRGMVSARCGGNPVA